MWKDDSRDTGVKRCAIPAEIRILLTTAITCECAINPWLGQVLLIASNIKPLTRKRIEEPERQLSLRSDVRSYGCCFFYLLPAACISFLVPFQKVWPMKTHVAQHESLLLPLLLLLSSEIISEVVLCGIVSSHF